MATGYHVMCGLASASETLSGQVSAGECVVWGGGRAGIQLSDHPAWLFHHLGLFATPSPPRQHLLHNTPSLTPPSSPPPPPLSSPQAAGAKNPAALAATLQRSLAVCTAAAVPITALWVNAEPILTALGQSPEIASGAARYLLLTLPALYSYMVFDCVDKHLLAQGVVTPGVAITAAATALTPLYCWYFVNQ